MRWRMGKESSKEFLKTKPCANVEPFKCPVCQNWAWRRTKPRRGRSKRNIFKIQRKNATTCSKECAKIYRNYMLSHARQKYSVAVFVQLCEYSSTESFKKEECVR